MGLWMRSCDACKASDSPETLLFSLQTSRHSKVGLCLYTMLPWIGSNRYHNYR